MMNKVFSILISLILFFNSYSATFAQTASPTPSSDPSTSCAPDNLSCLQNRKAFLEGQKRTYSSQIDLINTNIQLTEYKIEATKSEISILVLDIDTASKKIDNIQASIDNLTKVLVNRIKATYEVGSAPSFQILLTSNNVSDFVKRANYLKLAQAHDKRLIYDTVQAKNDYANQKNIFEGQKKKVESLKLQLQSYTQELDQEKQTKQQLLSQTQTDLDRVNAAIVALSNFARSRVGPGGQSVPHQDLSDGWGKYYNQRDSNWGNNLIGLSSEQIWLVGCLLTSYAMVVTHYGGSVSPAEIAANSSNFYGGSAYFNKPGPYANGHSVNDVSYPSADDIRNKLNSGGAVIAGLSYDGGPIADHWVVIRSVNDDGSMMINDPLYEGAMNVPMSQHYSGLKIVEARFYN